jgi:WD40 repeat protein
MGASIEPLWTAGTGGLRSNIALSPDGLTLLAGYDDGQARLFDATDGHFLRLLTACGLCAHASSIGLVTFSADGTRALTVAYDRAAKVWDVDRGTLLGVLTETLNQDAPNFGAFALSPDGSSVLVMNEEPVLWKVDSQKTVSLPLEFGEACIAVAFSPDGKRVLSGDYDRAWLWDLETGQKIHRFPHSCYRANINSAEFSRDGKTLLLAGYTGDPRIFDVESGKLVTTFGSPYDHTDACCSKTILSHDGNRAVTFRAESGACFWDANSGKPLGNNSKTAWYGNRDFHSGVFSPDGMTAYLTSRWGHIEVEDIASGNAVREPFWISDNIYVASFDAKAGQILGGEFVTGRISLWNAETATKVSQYMIPLGKYQDIGSVALSGELAAVGINSKGIVVLDVETGKTLQTLDEESDQQVALEFSPDGERILVGIKHMGMRLTVWKWKTNERTTLINLSDTSLGLSRFTVMGARALALEESGEATLWDVDNKRPLRHFAPKLGHLTTGAISPSGKVVLLGSAMGISTIWDAESGTRLCYLAGHSNSVYGACFSQDDALAATSSNVPSRFQDSYGEIKIWESATGRLLKSIRCENGSYVSLFFSLDSKFLFMREAGVIRKWPVFGTAVPDVVGQKASVATQVLESVGLDSVITETITDGLPPRLVSSQEPNAHTVVPEHSPVKLVVSTTS